MRLTQALQIKIMEAYREDLEIRLKLTKWADENGHSYRLFKEYVACECGASLGNYRAWVGHVAQERHRKLWSAPQ